MAQSISQILKERRTKNKKRRVDRIHHLEEVCPEFYDLIRKRNELLADIALLKVTGRHSEAENKEKIVESLDKREREILKERDLPDDYLEEIVTCPICNDTGIDQQGETCSCIKSILRKQNYGRYDMATSMKDCTFKNSKPELFSNKIENGYPGSARDSLISATNRASRYIDNFDNETSLYVTGGVGTGKTYYVSCIVNELLNRQHQIIYLSAPNLLNYLYEDINNRDKIVNSNKEDFKTIELLVIDDLGTEVLNKFVESSLTEIIDYRLIKNLKTIITSNYLPAALLQESGYPERMVSRIIGNYEVIPFFGSDLRNNY